MRVGTELIFKKETYNYILRLANEGLEKGNYIQVLQTIKDSLEMAVKNVSDQIAELEIEKEMH